jgi:FAD/FMN-containing dehydrogenase
MKYSALILVAVALTIEASVLDVQAVLGDCLTSSKVPTDNLGTEDWKLDGAVFNVRLPYKPISIAVPATIEDVQAAVKCATKAGVKVTAKCGGHSWANFGFGGEDGHLIIEMDRMHSVTLDNKTNIATVQGGSRLGHVAAELYSQGKRAISHGTCPG